MKNHVVQYVTFQYMKRNHKRTVTAFLGIVFMVLLMTCVFVGRDTGIAYLEDMGAARDGKWHASIYDINGEELSEIESMEHVSDLAISKSMGLTAFNRSENPEKPYLNIRAYSEKCFDWMNIELSEGRFPTDTNEIILSESVRENGSSVKIGDEISAEYLTRSITGIAEGVESVFPFQDITVKYGESVEIPKDFPYYGESDSFREDINYTGEKQNYRVVGFMKTPGFESGGSACYEALTWISPEIAAENGGLFNVSLMFDLEDSMTAPSRELRKYSENKTVAFNDYVLAFSGNSSDSTINIIVQAMTLFFLTVIIIASIILIYNLFNMSFEERSRYLGMLCSVGATGRQKRSSVYFEAFYLLLLALPTGFLLGLAVVQGGMMMLQPFVGKIWGIYGETQDVPVSLNILPGSVLLVLIVSIVTVFVSAYLPARKISKIGPIECIRGNEQRPKKLHSMDMRFIRRRGVEGMLARNSLRVQRRKTRGIVRSIIVFAVILVVTSFGVRNVTRIVSYRMQDDSSINYKMDDWDYIFGTMNGDFADYEAVKAQIEADEGVESVCEWGTGTFIGTVPNEVFSREYWQALHKVFNLYYHRELTDEEFNEHHSGGRGMINVVAVNDEMFSQIAEAADVDENIIRDAEYPAIVVQDGEVSTENWRVGGMDAERYQFYQIERMTDLEKGEIIPITLYCPDEKKNEDFPLTVSGYASNEQLEMFQFHSEQMWVIIRMDTGKAMNEILMSSDVNDDNYQLIQKHLMIKMNGNATNLPEKLRNMPVVAGGKYFFMDANYTRTLADSINAMIRILLYSFVILASAISMLSLHNSIRGRILGRRQEFAILKSLGATNGQIRKMLYCECRAIMGRSILWSAAIAVPLIFLIREFLIKVLGYMKISFPWILCGAAVILAAVILTAMTQRCFAQMNQRNVAEDIREERG